MAIATGASNQQAVINVTPMIDILLVLLITFIAIAPAKSVGFDTAIPQDQSSPLQPQPENPVVLEIARDGSWRLNSQAVDPSSLGRQLEGIYQRREQRVLFVKADRQLEFRDVAAALDRAHEAALDHVVLLRSYRRQ